MASLPGGPGPGPGPGPGLGNPRTGFGPEPGPDVRVPGGKASGSKASGSKACPSRITGWDHVGIRVSDRARSIAFYEALGFVESVTFPAFEANEMLTADGVRINLIFNGARRRDARNVLQDEPIKLPGLTHLAVVVDDLASLVQWLDERGIPITEGPEPIGPRRIALFIRDPDGNVIEFNQLIDSRGGR